MNTRKVKFVEHTVAAADAFFSVVREKRDCSSPSSSPFLVRAEKRKEPTSPSRSLPLSLFRAEAESASLPHSNRIGTGFATSLLNSSSDSKPSGVRSDGDISESLDQESEFHYQATVLIHCGLT